MSYMSIDKNVSGINGLCLVTPKVYSDERGQFMEAFNCNELARWNIDFKVVQENQSGSVKGTLRGLHFQIRRPQGKLVRVLSGEIYDVAVDLRKNSTTFGRYYGVRLSSDNKRQLLIPKGFAHGFLTLSDWAEVCYLCDELYQADDEGGIIWNDPTLAIEWPNVSVCSFDDGTKLVLSCKDKSWGTMRETLGIV